MTETWNNCPENKFGESGSMRAQKDKSFKKKEGLINVKCYKELK